MAYADGYVYQLWVGLGLMIAYQVNDDGSFEEVNLAPAPAGGGISSYLTTGEWPSGSCCLRELKLKMHHGWADCSMNPKSIIIV